MYLVHTNAHVHTTTHPCTCNTQICTYIYAHNTTHTCTHNTMCMQDGDCPLYIASQEGHDKTVEILLQAGAVVDLQNKVESYYSSLGENGVHLNLSNFDGTSYIH